MAMTMPITGEYVDVDGIRTFYIKKGSGPAFFLFHGASPGACTTVNWRPTIDFFAASGFTVYAFDQPGFGYTDNPSDYSMENRIRHARAFINLWGLDAFHLAGNSMGGYMVGRIALEEQERTQRLVIVASGGLGPPASPETEAISRAHARDLRDYTPGLDNMRALTQGTLFDQGLVTDELVQHRYEMSIGKNYEAQERRAGSAPLRAVNDELRSLRVKTLVVWGLNDRGSPVEKAVLLTQTIPGAELHVFDRCAHWPMWDQAGRFNTVVRDFLVS
jgi:2-hydroxy-6-oxonona-2,4-dienedioate hydrolase